jgi:hypothetical protein
LTRLAEQRRRERHDIEPVDISRRVAAGQKSQFGSERLDLFAARRRRIFVQCRLVVIFGRRRFGYLPMPYEPQPDCRAAALPLTRKKSLRNDLCRAELVAAELVKFAHHVPSRRTKSVVSRSAPSAAISQAVYYCQALGGRLGLGKPDVAGNDRRPVPEFFGNYLDGDETGSSNGQRSITVSIGS